MYIAKRKGNVKQARKELCQKSMHRKLEKHIKQFGLSKKRVPNK